MLCFTSVPFMYPYLSYLPLIYPLCLHTATLPRGRGTQGRGPAVVVRKGLGSSSSYQRRGLSGPGCQPRSGSIIPSHHQLRHSLWLSWWSCQTCDPGHTGQGFRFPGDGLATCSPTQNHAKPVRYLVNFSVTGPFPHWYFHGAVKKGPDDTREGVLFCDDTRWFSVPIYQLEAPFIWRSYPVSITTAEKPWLLIAQARPGCVLISPALSPSASCLHHTLGN